MITFAVLMVVPWVVLGIFVAAGFILADILSQEKKENEKE